MTDYRMRIAFNGTSYSGWQRQPGLHTVQQCVEETLQSVFQEKDLTVTASGRTDSGVHALDFPLSFRSVKSLPEKELTRQLKVRLPHDIRLLEIAHAPRFNAHTDALGKAYVYLICPGEPDIFLRGLCWNWLNTPINASVRTAVKMLPGMHDFRSFTGRHAAGNTVRTIYRAELIRFGPLVCFYLSGNGFLYKMVRRLAGFLYETAKGIHQPGLLPELLKNPVLPSDDRTVAPPEGLYLKKVFYRPEEWRQDRLDRPPFLF